MYEGMSDYDKYVICREYPAGNVGSIGLPCRECPFKGETVEQVACENARED